MASIENESSYYIRIKGRVFGPYSLKQLDKLRTRGQFSQSNEISTNGQTWEPASSLDSLFGTAAKKNTFSHSGLSDADSPVASNGAAAPWYFSIDGKQNGPLTLAELQEMLDLGQLNLNDLVWKDGMTDWEPASEVPELNRKFSAKARKGKKAGRGNVEADTNSLDDDIAPHFLDYVLAVFRSVGGKSIARATGRGAVELGRYAIYFAIVLNLVFCFVLAVKINSLNVGMVGIAGAVIALALQYSAVKCCGAIARLVRAIPLRMSSTAFLDAMAMIFLIGGVVVLAVSAVVWIRTQEPPWLLVGFVVFLIFEERGFMLLRPGEMGITVSDRVTPGEEAISLISFWLMLPLRTASSFFALGASMSIMGFGVAFYFLFTSKATEHDFEMSTAMLIAVYSGGLALISSTVPMTLYLYFVFAYLGVDVARTILVVPERLDNLAYKLASGVDASNANQRHSRNEATESVSSS